MLEKYFTLTISANAVAWYAATVATLTASLQLANHLRDRVKVKVTFKRDMEIIGDPVRAGMTFTLVRVVNTGRRPLTITNIGLQYLQGKAAVFTDTLPPLPLVLNEGQQVQSFADQSSLRFDDIRSFEAHDAAGREFRVNFAPWHKRVLWFVRRKATSLSGSRYSKKPTA